VDGGYFGNVIGLYNQNGEAADLLTMV